jgi:uncharacterized membrane protein
MAEETNAPEKNNEPESVVADYLQGYQQLELNAAESNLRKARNAIFAIAALLLIGDLISMAGSDGFQMEVLLFSLVVSGIFVALGFLTKKQPMTAIIIALILFLGLWIFTIIVIGPEQIYRGIIVYFLVTGIKHAKEAERLRKEIKNT